MEVVKKEIRSNSVIRCGHYVQ